MNREIYEIAKTFSEKLNRAVNLRLDYKVPEFPDFTGRNELAAYIDHTLLKPEANQQSIELLAEEAIHHDFHSVCIHPFWVPLAKNMLQDTGVSVCTVIGFPLGATTTSAKAYEAKQAVDDGAHEIDIVMNIGALKSGLYDQVFKDISTVINAAQAGDSICKVILETAFLNRPELIQASMLAKFAGADFIKTSTGFAHSGADIESIKIMRCIAQEDMGVKASGGVSDYMAACEMLRHGATRIGSSNSVNMVSGYHTSSQTDY